MEKILGAMIPTFFGVSMLLFILILFFEIFYLPESLPTIAGGLCLMAGSMLAFTAGTMVVQNRSERRCRHCDKKTE